jgi:hypothetical protein
MTQALYAHMNNNNKKKLWYSVVVTEMDRDNTQPNIMQFLKGRKFCHAICDNMDEQ